jgi:hypothetical protein
MFVVLIRRFVRHDREAEFLASYKAQVSDHPDFIEEKLTKMFRDDSVPVNYLNLMHPADGCLNYLNIAYWKDWKSFVGQCVIKEGQYDADIETRPRERVILEVVDRHAGS